MDKKISQASTVEAHAHAHCLVEGCHREQYTRGYCRLHYLEWWKSLRDRQWQYAEGKGEQEA